MGLLDPIRDPGDNTYLHVLPQGRGMRVALIAAIHSAVVGLIGRVNVRVLLAVRGVGESAVAAFVLTFERFFTCKIIKE